MNKPRALSEGDADLNFKVRFFFSPTWKIYDLIIVELDKIKLFVYPYIMTKKLVQIAQILDRIDESSKNDFWIWKSEYFYRYLYT